MCWALKGYIGIGYVLVSKGNSMKTKMVVGQEVAYIEDEK